MKISNVTIKDFKRFKNLSIRDVPQSAKLVVLAGPNGSGKSSLFDAFLSWYKAHSGRGVNRDQTYYDRPGTTGVTEPHVRVTVDFHNSSLSSGDDRKKLFYFRSANRNEPQINSTSVSRVGSILNEDRFARMIDLDAAAQKNYMRLASQALEEVLVTEPGTVTIGDYREKLLGEIRRAVSNLFPDLLFTDVGNPVDNGTFRFNKGEIIGFEYKNLSGGEKAAFDLLLDIIIKRNDFNDTIYCIDEPELHLNARIQAALLRELVRLVPDTCQLWLATHSIGMMRSARDLATEEPGSVVFLDFENRDFDSEVVMAPVAPTRTFWERVLWVALDDLSQLVAPKLVVVCEGNPAGSVVGKSGQLDADCYNSIFAGEMPDTKFLSAGSSNEVVTDRLAFVSAVRAIVSGVEVRRLIDHDDHGPLDVERFEKDGIRVLSLRNIESYLFSDEVLTALCNSRGKPELIESVLQAKKDVMAAIPDRAIDDIKPARGLIYVKLKSLLSLVAVGNSAEAFMRQTLAPLLVPGMSIYERLKADIFGVSADS